MKVLHLISQTPDFTGSGKFIQQILAHARRQGHANFLLAGVQAGFNPPAELIRPDRTVMVRFDGTDLPFPVAGMSDVMPYESTVFSGMSDTDLKIYMQVFRDRIALAVKRFQPDLIHSHHLWIASSIARTLAPDLPMVVTCHGTCLRQHRFCGRISREISPALKGVNRVIALNFVQQKEIVDRFGMDNAHVPVVAGGYDERLFIPGKKPDDGVVEICYAGKLSRAKGVIWLLKSLAKIRRLPFRLHLAGGGSGTEKDICLAMAAELGEKAVYHGTLNHRELAALMGRSHLFVLPSFYEGVPLVLMEALACGCRILATALPGTREILSPPDNDLISFLPLPPLETVDTPFEQDEPALEALLTEALERLILKSVSGPGPELALVRNKTRPYTWSRVFARINRVYEDAASEKG